MENVNVVNQKKNVITQRPSIVVENLFSCEHYRDKDNVLIPLLNDISFTINDEDIVGIGADNETELFTLIEILGNMRPFYHGVLQYSEQVVSEIKRNINDEVYYLDSSKMLFMHMNVLEHLMFVQTIKNPEADAGVLQKKTLDIIKLCGMEKYVVTPIKELTREGRMVLSILIACLSKCERIIVNAIPFDFNMEEAEFISGIFTYFKHKNKTIIMATKEAKLIGMACDRALYLSHGHVAAYGLVTEFYKKYDNVICSVKTTNASGFVELLTQKCVGAHAYVEKDYVYIMDYDLNKLLSSGIFYEANYHHIKVDLIRFNNGRIQNAFERIEATNNDLRE